VVQTFRDRASDKDFTQFEDYRNFYTFEIHMEDVATGPNDPVGDAARRRLRDPGQARFALTNSGLL
jgi:hypothetical protein